MCSSPTPDQDEARARQVAEALSAQGYRAWRDDELPAHRPYGEVIEERLNSAQAVVVLWSSDAKASQWVRAEADTARNRGTLIQASLDGTIPPIPFNQIQCADLNWSRCSRRFTWLVQAHGECSALWQAQLRSLRRDARGGSAFRSVSSRSPNMSGDPEQEYFSDGISEDITTDLSKVSALAVTARNTAFHFKGQSLDVCEVAEKLRCQPCA